MNIKLITIVALITFLTACGGGSSSSSNSIQLISKIEKIESNGCISDTNELSFDTSGNLIEVINNNYNFNDEQSNINCGFSSIDIDTLTFDVKGNLIKRSKSRDDGASFSEYTYNSYNHKTSRIYDDDADGVVDRIMTYVNTYDSNGNRLTQSTDYTTDGTVDYIVTWTYNEDGTGNPISKYEDFDADGTASRISNYVYDSNNNKLIEFVGDSTYIWTYDENNNVTNMFYDDDGDGVIDRSESNYVWVKADVKQDVSIGNSEDTDGDGIIDLDFIVTTRDSNNNVTEARYEESGVLGETTKIYWSSYVID